MQDTSQTICALATPRGNGAVGMIRISGPQAFCIARQLTTLKNLPPRRMVRARVNDPETGRLVDQVLVCAMKAPRSYTGEDVVEVFGHGGELNMDRLLTMVLRAGPRSAEPGEFTRRAFLNGRLDLTQAEAVAQIIAARSQRAVSNAQAILAGELGHKIGQIRDMLLDISARLEALIDFSEDLDIEGQGGANVVAELMHWHEDAAEQLVELADSYHRGRRLDGITVALVGPVNAGKSSLFNRLLGRKRALVSEEPGTTRDYLEAEVHWAGRRIVLVDTAGERPAGAPSSMERAGQKLAEEVVRTCDLLISVVDLSDKQGPKAALPAHHGPVIVAANKRDICPSGALEKLAADLEQEHRAEHWAEHWEEHRDLPVVVTSALRGDGLEKLKETILECLEPGGDGAEETVVVSCQRHWEALTRARCALEEGRETLAQDRPPELTVEHYREALAALGEITGQTTTEDVLDAVFGTFCIGK